jgi:hypothetical protein
MKAFLYYVSGAYKGKLLTLDQDNIRFGWDPACDVRFDPRIDRTTAPHHAHIIRQGEYFWLYDLGSPFHTYLNGVLVSTPTLLKTKDIIALGKSGPRIKFYRDKDIKKCPICGLPLYKKNIICPVCGRKVCLMCVDHTSKCCKACAAGRA